MRLAYQEHSDIMRAMGGLEVAVRHGPLELPLLELVKVRASQLNGWNRFAVAFRAPVGDYVPGTHA